MWCVWFVLTLVCVAGGETTGDGSQISGHGTKTSGDGGPDGEVTQLTTRQPPRTLDRQAGELAWRNWLQSPENGNPNTPPRRITTKSLFITPYVCPKGQRLDRDGCIQVLTVSKDDHERLLLDQINALFTSSPGEVSYDYGDGDEEPGPLQLSIPIGVEPQAAPLQALEPVAQTLEVNKDKIVINKKEQEKPNQDAGLEAELELMKLQNNRNNETDTQQHQANDKNKVNHSPLMNLLFHSEKPKRENIVMNATTSQAETTTDVGQKEQFYGHVNVDPLLYDEVAENLETTENAQETIETTTESTTEFITDTTNIEIISDHTPITHHLIANVPTTTESNNVQELKREKNKNKLNPETDYADIGEAINIISRYAEVTTDDSFAKDLNKPADKEENILGTRTKMQHRNRSKLKSAELQLPEHVVTDKEKPQMPPTSYAKGDAYYRYPWASQGSPTPPPDYPFRHLQDYWGGKVPARGLYNPPHENPRRHHHALPHTAYGNRGPYINLLADLAAFYNSQEPHAQPMTGKVHQHRVIGPDTITHKNQDLYTLLGLRHWFSTEGATKR